MSLTSKQIDELRAYAKDRKGELAKLINDAADTIERLSAQPEQRWIPCSERLPEEYGNYLVTTDDADVDIGTIDTDSKKWSACDANGFFWLRKVIAWMPLPEPFREEGEKNV